jgi:hypothetical protein
MDGRQKCVNDGYGQKRSVGEQGRSHGKPPPLIIIAV